MQSDEVSDMLLTADAAWLCAAELDVEREEMERLEVLARRRRREIRSKYELESTSTQLDAELKRFQLDRRKKVAREDRSKRVFKSNAQREACSTWEYVNTTKIQAIVRGHFGRKCYKRRKQRVAALHIQMLWRGYASRKQSDLLWLAHKAVNLQRLIRGVLSRKATRRRVVKYKAAAVQIQRIFRGMQARMVVSRILWDRKTRSRQEWMRVLEVEEEWCRVQRDKLQRRLERLQLHREVCELEEQYFRQHERISDMESIYLDMQTQRLRVSPRAIEQGWVEEMEEEMKIQRAKITEMKLDTIFKVGLAFKQKETQLLDYQRRVQNLKEKRQQFEIWREEEFFDYWERECRFQHKHKLVEKRKRIADQQRRWRIQRYHTSGKSDTRWRFSRWSNDVLDEAKKGEVFCAANADLLAVIQSKWRKQLEGTRHPRSDDMDTTLSEVNDSANQVALVATEAQIEQAKAIFDPVFADTERSYLQVQKQQRKNKRKALDARRARDQQQQMFSSANSEQMADATKVKDKASPVKRVMDGTASSNREQQKRQLVQAAKIPRLLLDQLAAERRKFEEEKAMFKAWRRSPHGGYMKITNTHISACTPAHDVNARRSCTQA
ncbi:Myosin v, partial [Globisporangium splendens]